MIYHTLSTEDQGLYNVIYDATLGCNNIESLWIMFSFTANTATSVSISRMAGFILEDYGL